MKPTFTSIADIVGYRTRIEQKLSPAITPTDTCPCGTAKPLHREVCDECLRTATKPVRTRYLTISPEREEWGLARKALLAHARTLRQIGLPLTGLMILTGCGRLTESETAFAKAVLWAFAVIGSFTLGGIVAYHRNKGDKEMGIADPDEEKNPPRTAWYDEP